MYLGVLVTELLITQLCRGITFIDLPMDQRDPLNNKYPPVKDKQRRNWSNQLMKLKSNRSLYKDETEDDIKTKIHILIQQSVANTDQQIQYVKKIKDEYREEKIFKVGFLVSMLNKSKLVMSELFNVAVKHKDEWKVLEQLKVFEMIIHTNLDATDLVRQLTEMNLQIKKADRNTTRVVLMK